MMFYLRGGNARSVTKISPRSSKWFAEKRKTERCAQREKEREREKGRKDEREREKERTDTHLFEAKRNFIP